MQTCMHWTILVERKIIIDDNDNLSNEKSGISTGGARKIRSRRYRRKNRSARKSKIFVRRSTVRRSRRRPNKKRLKSRKQ